MTGLCVFGEKQYSIFSTKRAYLFKRQFIADALSSEQKMKFIEVINIANPKPLFHNKPQIF